MVYEKQEWENLPAKTTPTSAERFAHMETQYDEAIATVGVFTPQMFGAFADGATDDAAAVQAAIDAAAAGGVGRVVFPVGDYYLASGVLLRDEVILSGYGARIVKLSGSDEITSFYTDSFRGTGYGAGASRWRIEGFDFVGIPDTAKCMISLHHAQDFQIVDCNFIDAQGAAHAIDMQGVRRGLIERCRFLGYEPGSIDKEAIQVDHSWRGGASVPETDTSRYDGLGSRDITVRACTAARSTTKDAPNLIGSHSLVDANYHRRILIEDNFIEVTINQNATSTDRRGSVHFMCAQDVTVRGNVFQRIGSATQTPIRFRGNTTGYASGQWATATPSSSTLAAPMQPANVEISGNTFRDWATDETGNMVHLWGVDDTVNATKLEGVLVSGNTFIGCAPPSGGTNGMNLLYFQHAGNVRVLGNTADQSRQFVYSESCRNLVIQGNTSKSSSFISFRAVGNTGTMIAGNTVDGSDGFVLVETASTNTHIVNNTFANKQGVAQAQCVLIRGASVGFVVSGNVVRGGTATYGVRTEGTSTGGVATGNIVAAGLGTAFSTEAGSAITVTGTVAA